jgi:hypothetical protein
MTYRIPNEVIVQSIMIPNAIVFVPLRQRAVRRYPTRCLHTNRQLEALGILLRKESVVFWNEVLS